MSLDTLRQNTMMQHLLAALERGEDIGHYGRLVFAMVARHFVNDDELIALLEQNPGVTHEQARALVLQVQGHDYSPPSRARIREWQGQQEFPICPTDDPDACNVYKDLQFPDDVYARISEYYEEKATER